MKLLSCVCRSEFDLTALGGSFSKYLEDGDLVLLEGELGAGKTCFARGIIQSLVGSNEVVTSPTFTLLNVFENGGIKIFHYDLYRLLDGSSIYDIEWEDARERGICIVEWPQYVPSRELPSLYWQIKIFYEKNSRLVEIDRVGAEGSKQISDDLKDFARFYNQAGEVGQL